MRLATLLHDGKTYVGVKVNEGFILTSYTSMIDLMQDGESGLAKVTEEAARGKAITDFRLMAPVPNPGKILCSGINFAAHSEEDPSSKLPEKPSVFSKLTNSIIGPGDSIVLPEMDSQVDYEVELAFVIGKTARKVKKAEALDYVFGYTVVNDVSGRALQFSLQHETVGKGHDTFCPMGPELVLKDEIPDPSQLHMRSFVNGEMRQNASASGMIFDIPTLIEFLTRYIALHPGDVITMGTPSGCGTFMDPPVFLKPGDEVIVEVDAVGKLYNRVVAGY